MLTSKIEKIKCRRCGGRKVPPGRESQVPPCPECKGKGEVLVERVITRRPVSRY